MDLWIKARTSILAFTLGSTFLVFGKLLFFPVQEDALEAAKAKSLAFPSRIPLPDWQQEHSSQAPTNPLEGYAFEGKNYQYTHNGITLSIDMLYVDRPHPNEKLFRKYNPSNLSTGEPAPLLRGNQETGFYSLFVHGDQAHLRTCINPRSTSAITYEQFIQNRYTYDLQFSRILPVLLGQETVRDHRCLWADLSVPADLASPDSAYQILEKVWISWYRLWHSQL